MEDKECRELAEDFRLALLCDQIGRLETREEAINVAQELVRLNHRMKRTVNGMIEQGWLDKEL
jgi:hypothetical protein